MHGWVQGSSSTSWWGNKERGREREQRRNRGSKRKRKWSNSNCIIFCIVTRGLNYRSTRQNYYVMFLDASSTSSAIMNIYKCKHFNMFIMLLDASSTSSTNTTMVRHHTHAHTHHSVTMNTGWYREHTHKGTRGRVWMTEELYRAREYNIVMKGGKRVYCQEVGQEGGFVGKVAKRGAG